MPINAKTVAFGGLLLALTEVCIILGSVIESNTLFLLAAASYFLGIVIHETNLKLGISFWTAGVFLGVFLAPNKLYVFSYAAMGLYILLVETVWKMLGRMSEDKKRFQIFVGFKFLIFNLLYITCLYVWKTLIFAQGIKGWMVIAVWAAGQIGLILYDKAYEYVQREIWIKIRGRLL